MEPPEGDEELRSWTPVTDLGFQDGQSSGYDPSCCTDFSGFLPHGTSDGQEPLSLQYNADRILHSAWNSLPSREPELYGEHDFWTRFLDPNVSAMDMLTNVSCRCFQFELQRFCRSGQTCCGASDSGG